MWGFKMKRLIKNHRSESGFTLIELLVVVLILGILSVIAVVAVNSARQTAINKACLSSAQTMAQALDMYKLDKQGVALTSGYSVLSPTYIRTVPPLSAADIATTGDYYLEVSYNSATGVYTIIGKDKSGTAIPGCTSN